MRQLRFNFTYNTGYVQPYPGQPYGVLNYPVLSGLSVTQEASQAEINAFTIDTKATIPYSVTFPVTSNQYIHILVPAQFGPIDTFQFGVFPVRFVWVNGSASGTNDPYGPEPTAGNPFFVVLNGVNYAYNHYVSQYPQNGTNLVLTLNTSVIVG